MDEAPKAEENDEKVNDTPVGRYPSLVEDYRLLRVLIDDHPNAVMAIARADGGKVFAFDMFVMGLIERSLHLVYGFMATFDGWNLVSAAPLVRLQIDNLVRLSYVARHPEMHKVAIEAMDTEFRHMEDPDGIV